jgi:hypothetical protein
MASASVFKRSGVSLAAPRIACNDSGSRCFITIVPAAMSPSR